jgi:hypothetical protein
MKRTTPHSSGRARSVAASSSARQSYGALGRALGCAVVLSCKSVADQACLDQFASAQATVLQVKAEDLASVEGSVASLEQALASCKVAGRSAEIEELSKAHAQLVSHEERLVRRAEMLRTRTEISPEELQTLVKSGDPKCPRGQAYVHGKAGPRIKCVGPQPIDMDLQRAQAYFKGRGYKRLDAPVPTELRFAYGAERIDFRYRDSGEPGPPRCVVVYPPPEMSWQEATTRLTGVSPARLKPNGSIPTTAGALRLEVEESPDKVIARIGDCTG